MCMVSKSINVGLLKNNDVLLVQSKVIQSFYKVQINEHLSYSSADSLKGLLEYSRHRREAHISSK
jgi:hypothetical protein